MNETVIDLKTENSTTTAHVYAGHKATAGQVILDILRNFLVTNSYQEFQAICSDISPDKADELAAALVAAAHKARNA